MADERADDRSADAPAPPPPPPFDPGPGAPDVDGPVIVPSIWSPPPTNDPEEGAAGSERVSPSDQSTSPRTGGEAVASDAWRPVARRRPRNIMVVIALIGTAVVVVSCVVGFLLLRSPTADKPDDVAVARSAFVQACNRAGGDGSVCGCAFDRLEKKWGLAHYYRVESSLSTGGQLSPADSAVADQAFADCR